MYNLIASTNEAAGLFKYDKVYKWGNNPVRKLYKKKACRILAKGRMGSILVEFKDGFKMITSWRSV